MDIIKKNFNHFNINDKMTSNDENSIKYIPKSFIKYDFIFILL